MEMVIGLAIGAFILYLWLRPSSRKDQDNDNPSTEPPRRHATPAPRPDDYLARWRVDYVDFDGVVTERVIRVVKVQPRLEKLQVWCELRRDQRTFNFSGLRAIHDFDTGLPVAFDQWLARYTAARKRKAT